MVRLRGRRSLVPPPKCRRKDTLTPHIPLLTPSKPYMARTLNPTTIRERLLGGVGDRVARDRGGRRMRVSPRPLLRTTLTVPTPLSEGECPKAGHADELVALL